MKKKLSVLFASTCAAALFVSCSASESSTDTTLNGSANPDSSEKDSSTYAGFNDCTAVLDWTKAEMLKRVGPYGLETYPYMYASWRSGGFEGDMAASTEAPAAEALSGADFEPMPGTSTTNTQETNVDEGDIVETDGRYVYSIIDNRVRSVDIDNAMLLSEIDLPQGDSQMVLTGDHLVVATMTWTSVADTIISKFAITDGSLELTRRDHLEGTLVSVRAVSGQVHIVLNSSFLNRVAFVSPRDGSQDSLDAAEKKNNEVVNALSIDDFVPRTFEEGPMGTWGTKSSAIDCAKLGHPSQFSGWGVTWVASIDMNSSTEVPVGTIGILAQSTSSYTSTESLYIATTRWDDAVYEEFVSSRQEPPYTDIHAFTFSSEASDLSYVASGRVEGTLLNSYSMSEYDGVLRVATTSYDYDFGGGQDNGVHILKVKDAELIEIGAVNGMGRGETIQGVRFDGPRGYVVTFRQVDPLYVLDLSDPTAPELVGELKVPGYSTYLKPIDGDRVITVGMAGTETGQITGAQVSVFDVSDPSNPRQVATAEIAQWSEATSDPHAFLWWAETGQIIVPKELVCDEMGGTGCESAVVLKLDGTTLTEQGRLFQWFPIRRAVIAQNQLVTVSAGGTKVSRLSDLSEISYTRFDIPETDAEDNLP
jgi:uncharacterized secreted protein with C-terminal beta-propeller domain